MTQFTNYWFADAAGAGTIGRSVQFGTATNTVFEKRKGSALVYSSYNTNNQSSASLAPSALPSPWAASLWTPPATWLPAWISWASPAPTPDAVALYDVTESHRQCCLGDINFPVNHVANNNFICQTVIAGWKVFSLNANNGLMAFYINPSVNSMILNIATAGASDVNLSWGNPGRFSRARPTWSRPSGWT